MMPRPGGCICGQVRYEVAGDPLRVTVCHCRWCQRATGGAFLIEPLFPRAAHRVTRGSLAVYDHRSEGSGKIIHVHFCANCGTKLFLQFERFPEICGVFGGTFDDPDWFSITPETARQIFTETARHDTYLYPGVPTFPAHSLALDGSLREAVVLPEPRLAGLERRGGEEGSAT
jgi:hypothetical protein